MAILTEENIINTSIIYLHQTSKRSQIIYITTLLAVVISLMALPFIYTTISVKGTGAMQSNVEKIELLAPSSGRLISVNLTDNQKVLKGTTLLTIDATLPHQQNGILNNHTIQLQKQLHDVLSLLSFNPNQNLQTDLYTAAWQQYDEQLQNAKNAELQTLHIYERYKMLFNKKVVTPAEYEQNKFNYDQAVSERSMITKKIKTQWQTEANQYRNELRDLQNQKIQLEDQEKQYVLTATISGSVQNLTGVQIGSYVYANQKLGEISPDTALLAYSYVKPEDIGLIKKGQEVLFQMNAFNYNQWGSLTGNVVDISDDIIMQNQSPYFRVKCKLNKNYLQLKNGIKGQVKKGMTFSVRFTVTERNLYQLLYDRIDDWLNPSTNN